MTEYDNHSMTATFTTNTSSCITTFTYTADDYYCQYGNVTVTLTSGKTYHYKRVSNRHAFAVINAYMDEESVGAAYNKFIRTTYTVPQWDHAMDCEVFVEPRMANSR